jgi:hypothetical protein
VGRSSRDKNESEHLKGILRNLKAENRHLKKQLSRLQKEAKITEAFMSTWDEGDEDLVAPEALPDPDKPSCPKCRRTAVRIDLGTRSVLKCKQCGTSTIKNK